MEKEHAFSVLKKEVTYDLYENEGRTSIIPFPEKGSPQILFPFMVEEPKPGYQCSHLKKNRHFNGIRLEAG